MDVIVLASTVRAAHFYLGRLKITEFRGEPPRGDRDCPHSAAGQAVGCRPAPAYMLIRTPRSPLSILEGRMASRGLVSKLKAVRRSGSPTSGKTGSCAQPEWLISSAEAMLEVSLEFGPPVGRQ